MPYINKMAPTGYGDICGINTDQYNKNLKQKLSYIIFSTSSAKNGAKLKTTVINQSYLFHLHPSQSRKSP